ncbi:MAG: chromosomal replication initiator protein DnaA [Planctomycetota bacterium]|jgi:chromosomal replication initiator protein
MQGPGLWEAVLAEVEKRVRPHQFHTWFRRITPLDATPARLCLAVPNVIHSEWLETHYARIIKESAAAVTGQSPGLEIEIVPGDPAGDPAPGGPATDEAPLAETAPGREGADGRYPFSKAYTFDNFVIGPANRLCHAAAIAVVDAPGRAYNPLFIHGGVGLGKTHLLQAACQSFLAKHPGGRLLYTSCEEFVNDFVSAVGSGNITSLRARMRDLDFLVIDDIQFLARAERTQEEFFHTFNSLYNAHKQIILSSDSQPAGIPSLEERLISRFKWGLVAHLDPPTYETRLAIVRRKASLHGKALPADVAEFIARNVTRNIRELEGALTRVRAYASLSNRPLTLALAHEALQDVLSSRPSVSIEDIARAVAARYSVKLSDLQGRRRSKSIALPRQICMHIARRLTDYSLEEIGGFFGGRDHTTVMYADDKITGLLKTDAALLAMVSELQASLGRPRARG